MSDLHDWWWRFGRVAAPVRIRFVVLLCWCCFEYWYRWRNSPVRSYLPVVICIAGFHLARDHDFRHGCRELGVISSMTEELLEERTQRRNTGCSDDYCRLHEWPFGQVDSAPAVVPRLLESSDVRDSYDSSSTGTFWVVGGDIEQVVSFAVTICAEGRTCQDQHSLATIFQSMKNTLEGSWDSVLRSTHT